MMLLIFLVLNSFIGFSFLSLVGFIGYKIEKIALGFLLSTGALTYFHFLVSKHTNIVTRESFYMLLLFVTAVTIASRLIYKRKTKELKYKSNKFTVIVWIPILLLWLLMSIYTAFTPIWNADTIHLYDFRALVMFHTETFSSIESIHGWFNYPLFTTNILLFSRYIGLSNPGPLFPLFYLCFAILFFSVLCRSIDNHKAALGTLIMFATPLTLWQSRDVGLTNLVYSIFISSSVFYLIEGILSKRNSTPYVIVSFALLCIAVWCRMIEPLWLAPLSLLLFASIVKKKPSWLALVILFFIYRYTWVHYVSIKILNFETAASGMTQLVSNLSLITSTLNKIRDTLLIQHVLKVLFPVIYIFAAIAGISLISGVKKIEILYLYNIAGIISILFAGILFFASFVPGWDNSIDSVARLVSVLPPLMWMFIFKSHIWRYEKNITTE